MTQTALIPHLGHHVVFVPRDQLRRKQHGRTLRLPTHLQGLLAGVPTAAPAFDGSKGRSIVYTCWWNNQLGDCYEEDALHCILTWLGNNGKTPVFDPNAIRAEYLSLSGGDNGLGDDQVFPHWKNPGFQGHKILDDLTVDPRDDAAIRLGLQKFFGGSYTAALPDKWVQGAAPGVVWDVATPNQNNGHAMHLSGYVTKGQPMPFDALPLGVSTGGAAPADFYYDETWGFGTPVFLTPAGLKGSDPEVTIQFSLDMFNAQGVAPDGETYEQKAALWEQLGGQTLPPSPFGPNPNPFPPQPVPPNPVPNPPGPGPTPAPPASGFSGAIHFIGTDYRSHTLTYSNGILVAAK